MRAGVMYKLHTVLRSVMTRTMQPVPATSVSCRHFQSGRSHAFERSRAHLLVPAEKDTARHLSRVGHRHALVEVLHERVVRLW